MLSQERRLWRRGIRYIAGVDEAGRGPLAGPVVAAAVIFPPEAWIPGVDDSKNLSPQLREKLFPEIQSAALSIGVGLADHSQIDMLNIREASLLAMLQAIAMLDLQPDYILVDGNHFRLSESIGIPFKAMIHGDARCFSIAAASIIAKVTRDRLMQQYHGQYPWYGFDRHKGYATPEHIRAIREFGLCEIHRRTFHVRELER